MDYIINKAAENGLYIAFLPTWGDKLFKAGWGKGPEVFNEANAKTHGKWLGNRYKNKKNLIWILGGDRNPPVAKTMLLSNRLKAKVLR